MHVHPKLLLELVFLSPLPHVRQEVGGEVVFVSCSCGLAGQPQSESESEMDGWMGGWVNVQHTLALESYKHNNNYFFLIEQHFFLVI